MDNGQRDAKRNATLRYLKTESNDSPRELAAGTPFAAESATQALHGEKTANCFHAIGGARASPQE